MMKALYLHHVSLTVSNLAKSIAFYRDILCLEELERPDFDFEGAWFRIGEGQLHIIVDESLPKEPKQVIDARGPHFAIRVDDYQKTVEWLKENQIEILEKPDSVSGFAQIFCCDPDGNIIELHVERSKES
ncbi:VOC family protein [Halalkalibacter nanhaiisediminis]|uniref:Catechol 2,3-dioxygenase-like lactoylglutathione lyase family enzyme n=1 Tax=Halalkalibacter nanhaiisediminis TaxID=688079 RepID=A0A562QSN6_9BACI|nr:VOC family protein [Halalkalibacter nanhaiisediminis]TWI59707.1 catechol 2,3-dioxygenase-like lactoylglutathione lyase family enzyme [Halalkalibacter nanhaiisediminis]